MKRNFALLLCLVGLSLACGEEGGPSTATDLTNLLTSQDLFQIKSGNRQIVTSCSTQSITPENTSSLPAQKGIPATFGDYGQQMPTDNDENQTVPSEARPSVSRSEPLSTPRSSPVKKISPFSSEPLSSLSLPGQTSVQQGSIRFSKNGTWTVYLNGKDVAYGTWKAVGAKTLEITSDGEVFFTDVAISGNELELVSLCREGSVYTPSTMGGSTETFSSPSSSTRQ